MQKSIDFKSDRHCVDGNGKISGEAPSAQFHSNCALADKPENRGQFYLVVHAFILFCVGVSATVRGLAQRLLTGLKLTQALCFNPISVSLEDALDDVAIGLETNKFVAQVAA